MWTKCSTVLDAPVSKWGFEFDDLMVLAAFPIVIPFVLSFVVTLDLWALGWVLGLWGVLAAILYWGKRGKPAGALPHWLHVMQLVGLPGLLSPRPRRYSPW